MGRSILDMISIESADPRINTVQHEAEDVDKDMLQLEANILASESLLKSAIAMEDSKAVRVGNYLAQGYVVSFKHFITFFTESLASTKTLKMKYREKLLHRKSEYDSKKETLEFDDPVITLNQMWFFFNCERLSKKKNLFALLKEDLDFSNYVLNTYTKDLIKELTRAVNKPTDVSSVKNSRELFSEKYMLNEYFECSQVLEKVSLESSVQLKIAARHTAAKYGSSLIGPYIGLVKDIMMAEFHYDKNDLEFVLEAGLTYLKNVDEFLNNVKNLKLLIEKSDGSIGGIEFDRKVKSYALALQDCCLREVKRSLKGAKYCELLAARMIFNA